jgi:hypothetical protein
MTRDSSALSDIVDKVTQAWKDVENFSTPWPRPKLAADPDSCAYACCAACRLETGVRVTVPKVLRTTNERLPDQIQEAISGYWLVRS